jgi:GT2 family glycosyltransferase
MCEIFFSLKLTNRETNHGVYMANAPALVSLVMLSWNRVADVRESLEQIAACDYPNIEVIVCDNGSTDGTAEMIHSQFPDVLLIETGMNMGIEAYNIGFRSSRGQYVVILDDDSFPAPKALTRMVEKFEADPELGIVAFDVRNYFSYDEVAKESGETDTVTATTENYSMGFNGAGAGVRREVFEKAGYYPGEFFLYMNEPDLSLRTLQAGFKIKFFSDVVSYHKFSPANRASWRAPFYYCRNSFWLLWKNYPLGQAAMLTVKLGQLVAYHSIEQRTTVYLKAFAAAVFGIGRIIKLRSPVRPSLAREFRAPLELAFTFYR